MFLGFTARLLLDVNNTIFPILPTTSACKVFSTRKGRGNDISERAALALLRVHGTHSGFVGLHSASRWTGSIFFPPQVDVQTNRETKKHIQTDSTKSDYRTANTRFFDIIALFDAVRVCGNIENLKQSCDHNNLHRPGRHAGSSIVEIQQAN